MTNVQDDVVEQERRLLQEGKICKSLREIRVSGGDVDFSQYLTGVNLKIAFDEKQKQWSVEGGMQTIGKQKEISVCVRDSEKKYVVLPSVDYGSERKSCPEEFREIWNSRTPEK